MKNKYGKLPYSKTKYGKAARRHNAMIAARSAMTLAVGVSQINAMIGVPGISKCLLANAMIDISMAVMKQNQSIKRFA